MKMSLIKPLDNRTRQNIKSTYTFSSFSSIVEQLVLNSIDARSTVIEIRYSLRGFNVTVDDNGDGICFDDLINIGKPHYTSKMSSMDDIEKVTTYGFQGIMLNSLSTISRLEVTSRSRNSFQSYRKLVSTDDNSKPFIQSRHIGTTISCTEILRSLSVRRLHILSHENQEHEKIVRLIQKYSFVHPRINFQLRHEQRMVFLKQPTNTRKDLLQFFVHRVLKIGNSSEVKVEEFLSSLRPVNFTSKDGLVKIQGFLSCKSIFSSTSYQWIFINKRIVDDSDLKRTIKNRYHQKRSRLKDSDTRQHPVFFLNIFVTNDTSSNNNDGVSSTSKILRMSSYHFEDRTFLYYKKKIIYSSITEFIRSFFNFGVVVKKPVSQNNEEIVPPPPPPQQQQHTSRGLLRKPIFGQSVKLPTSTTNISSVSIGDHKKKKSIQELIRHNSQRNPVYTRHEQDRKKESFRRLMNNNNGINNNIPPPPQLAHPGGRMIIKGSNLPFYRRRNKKKENFGTVQKEEEEEEEISQEKSSSRIHQVFGYQNSNRRRQLVYTNRQEIKITKEVLSQMEVLSQVDRKFIIIKSDTTVFAVDQHAADERVQLEKLESEVYHVCDDGTIIPQKGSRLINQYILTPPQKISCTFLQNNVIELNSTYFNDWFWEIQKQGHQTANKEYSSSLIHHHNNADTNITYFITRAPEVCGVRLGLAEFGLFLQQVGSQNEGGKGVYPKPVQNILSYKACRSAVKFGDYLSKGRCKEILKDLKGCKFPFQCAHGRPSIQPLFRY